MASVLVERRDGTVQIRPRCALGERPVFTEADRRNVDALAAMFDALDTLPAASISDPLPHWHRRVQHGIVEDTLRVLSAGVPRPEMRRQFDADLAWVRDDTGSPGCKLSEVCVALGWDHARIRTRLLAVARDAIAGNRRRVPKLVRTRRTVGALVA